MSLFAYSSRFRLGLVTGALALLAPTAYADSPRIGAPAPGFTLPAADGGRPVALKQSLGKHGALLIFVATRCPVSNGYNDRMAAIARDYVAKGVTVIGINSNKTEPVAEIVDHSKKHGFSFPVVKDEGARVADLYGAQKTPEAYLVDARGTLVYHGRIDENLQEPQAVRSPDLRHALDALIAGKPIPIAETKAFGCSIKR